MICEKTNVEKFRNALRFLFDSCDFKPVDEIPFVCLHPFTNSPYNMVNGEIVNLAVNEKAVENFRDQWFKQFAKCNDVQQLFNFVRNPYYLTLLKITEEYLSLEDFSHLLKKAWTGEEDPNNDVNVTKRQVIKWFKKADKKAMMDKEELEYFSSLPEKFTVYRGVAYRRNLNGLSYTRNKSKALWFANRFGDKNKKLIEAKISKENALAYFNNRNEDEIVVDVFSKNFKNCMKIIELS